MIARTPAVLDGVGRLLAATEGDVTAFVDFLAGSPVPAVLLLVGGLLTGVSVAVLGYLGAGAVLEAFIAPAFR